MRKKIIIALFLLSLIIFGLQQGYYFFQKEVAVLTYKDATSNSGAVLKFVNNIADAVSHSSSERSSRADSIYFFSNMLEHPQEIRVKKQEGRIVLMAPVVVGGHSLPETSFPFFVRDGTVTVEGIFDQKRRVFCRGSMKEGGASLLIYHCHLITF